MITHKLSPLKVWAKRISICSMSEPLEAQSVIGSIDRHKHCMTPELPIWIFGRSGWNTGRADNRHILSRTVSEPHARLRRTDDWETLT